MTDARNTAAKLAAQINEIVSARGSNYGAPEDNFANIANLWNAWLHARHKCLIALDPVDVGVMSSLIKVARLAQTPGHEDSALDGAIYMLLGYGCGVSDREPGMSDFNFDDGLREKMTATTPEPVKADKATTALDKQGSAAQLKGLSLLPYNAKRDANNFSKVMYGTGYCPQESYYIVFKLKHGIEISQPTSTAGLDWVEWTKNAGGVGVDKWRYATDAEVIAFEEGKSNV